jgi:hypothetical protein
MRRSSSITALLVFVALPVGTVPAQAVEMHTYGRPFCQGKKVRDYEAPLAHLPQVRHAPENEDLPFGPRNMSIYQSALSRVIVGKGGFGYGFFDDTYGIREKVDLDWDVKTTLSRIDRRGQVLRQVDSEEQYFGVVTDIGEEMRFWLDTPAGPALYRYDIEFRDHASGDLLGSYSEYLRVVKPTFHARIAVNRPLFHPGEQAFARIENRGTSWIEFGLPYAVERFEGGRWVDQPLGVGAWLMPAIFMAGGQTGWCMQYRVPADASPGLYRFVKGLTFWKRGERDGKRATAAFRVQPS